MNYSDIKFTDMINGKGIRVTLFVSGCIHRCKGCFNKETWDSEYGVPFTEEIQENILEYFKRFDSAMQGLSLLGGDPTYYKNVEPLTEFTAEFKKRFPKKNIWIWSGFTWEQIITDPKKYALMKNCDVLIDGKFTEELKDVNLKWRGSSNQRVIDIQATIENNNEVVLYEN